MTGRLGLAEINAGFDRLREGKAVRQVVGLSSASSARSTEAKAS